ncbi:MAG: type III polyketide synthase [Bacteroidota bacterium]|jgi:predicted naringenin-chalcone synthase|nr:type III polyketide synthase [Bacteroidota bacterium]MDQ3536979.1 type III polyketide synthase [Bacteroidota bacterium]
MKCYINAIGTAIPDHTTPQLEISRFMASAMQVDEKETSRFHALYRASGIKQRSSVLEDYANNNGDYTFYPNTKDLEPFPGTAKRMEIYKKEAIKISLTAIEKCLGAMANFNKDDITHIITVSCTGFYAPGLDIEIIEALDLPRSIQRSAINFMGCYAAFNALKLGDAICRSDNNARVLILCVELCSIHFQKEKDDDNILANALFGDGAAAMILSSEPTNKINLYLRKFYCDLALEGKNEMAWHIGDNGFEMKLSSYVPEIIKGDIKQFTNNLLKNLNITLSDINHFAIHPGGKRILETIETELGISKENNKYAYEILRDHGNMSSATIVFVIEALIKNLDNSNQGDKILSFAFGPGLTLESMLLEVELDEANNLN